MKSRRDFIKKTGAAAILTFGGLGSSFVNSDEKRVKLTILHTNDTHSRLDPFEESHPKYPSMGGIAKRASLINQIRSQEEHVLLLDSGDIFQGTPYFNFYGGELNFKLMTMLGYDAATIGNHDLDNGVEGFKKHLHLAKFPFVVSNYDFDNTSLNGLIKKYQIFQKGPIKIGVLGAGIMLEGLVDPKNYKGIGYYNPVDPINALARMLKQEKGCHLVLVLSHLGYDCNQGEMCDVELASKSEFVDLIIGGHSHTFMDQPTELDNMHGQKVLVTQAGFGGIRLGRMDYFFDLENKSLIAQSQMIDINNQIV